MRLTLVARVCNQSEEWSMSIASTAVRLARANAAHKAAQAAHVAVAKRGMLGLIARRHSYTSLLHGAYAGYIGYTPCIVTSVDRAGFVKEARLAGQSWTLKRRDWDEITVDSAGRIADPQAVVAALVDDRGFAIEYRDKAEAIVAIKQAAGIEP
jgi:hypothetical protein